MRRKKRRNPLSLIGIAKMVWKLTYQKLKKNFAKKEVWNQLRSLLLAHLLQVNLTMPNNSLNIITSHIFTLVKCLKTSLTGIKKERTWFLKSEKLEDSKKKKRRNRDCYKNSKRPKKRDKLEWREMMKTRKTLMNLNLLIMISLKRMLTNKMNHSKNKLLKIKMKMKMKKTKMSKRKKKRKMWKLNLMLIGKKLTLRGDWRNLKNRIQVKDSQMSLWMKLLDGG